MMKKIVGFIASLFIITLFSIGSAQAVTTFSSYWLNSEGQPQGPFVIGSCEIHQIYEYPCASCTEQKMLAVAYGNGDCEDTCNDWIGSQTHTVTDPALHNPNFTIDLQKNWTHKSYQFWANGLPINQLNGTIYARGMQVDKKCTAHAREINASQWFCPEFGLVRESTNLFFNTFNNVDTQELYSRVPGFVMCFDADGNDIE